MFQSSKTLAKTHVCNVHIQSQSHMNQKFDICSLHLQSQPHFNRKFEVCNLHLQSQSHLNQVWSAIYISNLNHTWLRILMSAIYICNLNHTWIRSLMSAIFSSANWTTFESQVWCLQFTSAISTSVSAIRSLMSVLQWAPSPKHHKATAIYIDLQYEPHLKVESQVWCLQFTLQSESHLNHKFDVCNLHCNLNHTWITSLMSAVYICNLNHSSITRLMSLSQWALSTTGQKALKPVVSCWARQTDVLPLAQFTPPPKKILL